MSDALQIRREANVAAMRFAASLEQLGVPREKAVAQAALKYGPGVGRADDDARAEKAIVAAADKQLRALGFTVWNLSQPRASKIAAGVPDRLYTCPARGLALFWEAKSATGAQRPDQRVFQEHMDACGWPYILGTDRELYAWLVAHGIATVEGALLVAAPYTPRKATP